MQDERDSVEPTGGGDLFFQDAAFTATPSARMSRAVDGAKTCVNPAITSASPEMIMHQEGEKLLRE
jgi:hypothetical protein